MSFKVGDRVRLTDDRRSEVSGIVGEPYRGEGTVTKSSGTYVFVKFDDASDSPSSWVPSSLELVSPVLVEVIKAEPVIRVFGHHDLTPDEAYRLFVALEAVV